MSRFRSAVLQGTLWVAVFGAAATFVTPGVAQALIVVPGFVVAPGSGAARTSFDFGIEFPNPGGSPNRGCPLPLDYVVWGPGSDPSHGDYGPRVTNGTLAANTVEPDGSTSADSATIAPLTPGTYSVTVDPQGENTICYQGGSARDIGRGEFTVTGEPPPARPLLTLTPDGQSPSVDNTATVTAALATAGGAPIAGAPVSFSVTGPNSQIPGTCATAGCVTDGAGHVSWSYAGSNVGHDTVNVTATATPGDSPVRAQTSVDWTPTVNGAHYAALGDSYSAGEGLYAYIDGTFTPGVNMCHRSVLAYGPTLDRDYALGSLGFAACSGAVTHDLFSTNHAGNSGVSGLEPAQLCRTTAIAVPAPAAPRQTVTACGAARLPVIGPNTKRVTLTIGGNDAGFVSTLVACTWGKAGKLTIGSPGRNCALTPSVARPVYERLSVLAGVGSGTSPAGTPIHPIAETLRSIHAVAPNAQVFIAGYPLLFQNRTGRDCTIGEVRLPDDLLADLRIAPTDALWLDSLAVTLNTIILRAARQAGPWATYVDAASQFDGHGICSTNPWINKVVSRLDLKASPPLIVTPESVHPDLDGVRRGYEPAFATAGISNRL